MSSTFAQEKDTLFFAIDKYYTISPTLTANLDTENYSQWIKTTNENMNRTKTNGYIFFIGDGYLIKNLKPKKILSIKEYIENRKFYFDGKYNQIVDKRKLQDSLINKHIIYFVNGNQFIRPRELDYISYYPRRDRNWKVVQNNIKDTLYFKLDNEYIYQSTINPEWYLIKDSTDNQQIFFQKGDLHNNSKIGTVINFKEFVQSSRFYNKDKKQKLDEKGLADFFSNYVVYFVKSNQLESIQVSAGVVVYD